MWTCIIHGVKAFDCNGTFAVCPDDFQARDLLISYLTDISTKDLSFIVKQTTMGCLMRCIWDKIYCMICINDNNEHMHAETISNRCAWIVLINMIVWYRKEGISSVINEACVTIGVWGWIDNFISHFIIGTITYPCWDEHLTSMYLFVVSGDNAGTKWRRAVTSGDLELCRNTNLNKSVSKSVNIPLMWLHNNDMQYHHTKRQVQSKWNYILLFKSTI